MGAANFGGAGMTAFAASRVRTIKGGNGKEPKNNDWWIPLVIALTVISILILIYYLFPIR